MAKGPQLTQKDLMIWTMQHPNGIKYHYVIEKAPFEKDGFKKAVHLPGTTADSMFDYRDQAEAALKLFPPGDEEAEAKQAGGANEAGDETDDEDETDEKDASEAAGAQA